MHKKQPRPNISKRLLTDQQIAEVRLKYNTQNPKPTIMRLAQLYGVSYNCMWRALRSGQPNLVHIKDQQQSCKNIYTSHNRDQSSLH